MFRNMLADLSITQASEAFDVKENEGDNVPSDGEDTTQP